MVHLCHAHGCEASVPPRMLMCRKHWGMVPRALQREIWKHFRPGQEIDKSPSAAYRQAQQAAIASVASRENEGGRL